MMVKNQAIVVGAGVVGLATAYTLIQNGIKVTILEKNSTPTGASIRNFGMIWPIGQPSGPRLELALASRAIWLEMSNQVGFHLNPNGSLHLAYHQDEKDLLVEFIEDQQHNRKIKWLNPEQAAEKSQAINTQGLLGAMYSEEEMLIDPREAISKLFNWLGSHPSCTLLCNTPILSIDGNTCSGPTGKWTADQLFICSGAEIELLYPNILKEHGVLCELQMMRTGTQPNNFKLGPSLCGGLTLLHYQAFHGLTTLKSLSNRLQEEHNDLLNLGIHVMAAQNHSGEVTIGDSHQYAPSFEPFIQQSINQKILDYLDRFCRLPDPVIQSYWKGVYFKLNDNKPYLIHKLDEHCTLVNGFGGNGMTLAFGTMQRELASM